MNSKLLFKLYVVKYFKLLFSTTIKENNEVKSSKRLQSKILENSKRGSKETVKKKGQYVRKS